MNRTLLSVPIALASILAAGEAGAVERQHRFGLDPSLAILAVEDKSTASTGVGLGLHYTYGLTDQFNFMAEVGSAIVAKDQGQDIPETPKTRPGGVDHIGVGVGYVIDILQWVPYLCVLGSGYRLSGGTLEKAVGVAGVELGLGLDYQVTRHVTVGIGGRQQMLLSQWSTYPSYTTAFLRLEYVWGF